MKNILFICQGNMVRSQIAEALYNKYRGSGAVSAGILPEAEHRDGKKLKDLNLDDWIRLLRDKEGADISEHICKQVTEQMVDGADTVVVMAKKEIWPKFLLDRADAVVWDNVKDSGDISTIIDEVKELVLSL